MYFNRFKTEVIKTIVPIAEYHKLKCDYSKLYCYNIFFIPMETHLECLRGVCGVIEIDRVTSETVKWRVDVGEIVSDVMEEN